LTFFSYIANPEMIILTHPRAHRNSSHKGPYSSTYGCFCLHPIGYCGTLINFVIPKIPLCEKVKKF